MNNKKISWLYVNIHFSIEKIKWHIMNNFIFSELTYKYKCQNHNNINYQQQFLEK